jgi:mRNA interferase MazF
MDKNFDQWNVEKQKINASSRKVLYHPREIWWCSFGVNVGREQDGKGEHFRRPVIIIHGFNPDTFLGVALVGRKMQGKYYFPLGVIDDREASVSLSQVRIFDVKRLDEKIMMLDQALFEQLKSALQQTLFPENISLVAIPPGKGDDVEQAEAIVDNNIILPE